MMRKVACAFIACVAGALLPGSGAQAALSYTAEYVFGDSLSDNGNIAAAFGVSFPNPPSYHDSFTNGPVAVQWLAQAMGLSLEPSLWTTAPASVSGTNYAVGGATAATGIAPFNLPQQVGAYSLYNGGVGDPDALYVVMIGGNDLRNAARDGTGAAAITAGVNTELAAISALALEGARNFLIVNVPNVGVIPEFTQDHPSLAADATAYSRSYNAQLAGGLAALESTLLGGASVDLFDLYGFGEDILANAAAFGFTNTTDPCFTDTPSSAATTAGCGPGGANIDQYIYWDKVHPTARLHRLWAQAFGQSLGVVVPVPEISTWSMLLVAFAGIGVAQYGRALRTRRVRADSRPSQPAK